MAIRKTLTSIVLAGALALGTIGCRKDHSQYEYNGKIGEEQVTFTERNYFIFPDDNILTITKSDGRFIKYLDYLRDDLQLEYVEIIANGETTRYTAYNGLGKTILEESQKQFDVYLRQIIETKTDQGLKNLK